MGCIISINSPPDGKYRGASGHVDNKRDNFVVLQERNALLSPANIPLSGVTPLIDSLNNDLLLPIGHSLT